MIDVKIYIGKEDNVQCPAIRIDATRTFTQALCEAAGEGPSDGVMILLSTAALITKECAAPDMTKGQRIRLLAQCLGHAIDSVDEMLADREDQEDQEEARA